MTYLFVPQKYNYFCRYTRCDQFFIKEKVFSGRSQSELLFYRPLGSSNRPLGCSKCSKRSKAAVLSPFGQF